jgi:galactokinase
VIKHLGFQGRLDDPGALADRLRDSGLGEAACRQKAALFAKVAATLADGPAAPARGRRSSDDSPGGVHAFFVPGRIEVLGKHTDYAGGRSLVAATECGFCLAVRGRADRSVRLVDAERGQRVEFPLGPELAPGAGHWSNYPMTVARRLARNFPGIAGGAEAAFASDLPVAAGMSSSSAMMVAVYFALAEVNGLARRSEFLANIHTLLDLAGYLGTVENGQTFGTLEGDRGVGTFGGSEDHTAILTALPGQVSQYAYCPVRFERALPLPADLTLAVAVSGVVAEKTGAAREKYNAASQSAGRLAALWNRHAGQREPHLSAILARAPGNAGQLARIVESEVSDATERAGLRARLEHFVIENEQILLAAGDALARDDRPALAALVERSQAAAETLLGNQVPETSHLAAAARRLGAVAASAFGAGFGGSVWALVETARARSFLSDWAAAYHRRFPGRAGAARFFAAGAGPAAFQVC